MAVTIPVQKTTRFNQEVWLSELAEQGRKNGCLCIHVENGQKVMCRRLENNIRLQERLKQELGEHAAEFRLGSVAIAAFYTLIEKGKGNAFEGLQPTDPCPIALVNYELCKAGNVAFATSWCRGYLAPEEKKE